MDCGDSGQGSGSSHRFFHSSPASSRRRSQIAPSLNTPRLSTPSVEDAPTVHPQRPSAL